MKSFISSLSTRTAIISVLLSGLLLMFAMGALGALGDPFATTASVYKTTTGEHSIPVSNNTFWGPSYKRPYPTNTWWINLVLPGFGPIATYPYIIYVNTDSGYFAVCYPKYAVSNLYQVSAYLNDIIVGAKEPMGGRKVMSHDDLSVLTRISAATDGSNKYMESPIVRGQTYHTVEYKGLTPLLSTVHAFTEVNGISVNSASGPITGDKFKVKLSNGQTWLVYTSASVSWTVSGLTSLIATNTFTGVLRVAILNDATHETIFDQYRNTYPYTGHVTYSVSGDTATIKFAFTKKGTDNLIMFTLPHHRDMMSTTNPQMLSALTLRSIKGSNVAIVGDQWTLLESLVNDVGFQSRYQIPDTYKQAIQTALTADQNSIPTPMDPYFGGKAVARLGRLAVIADEFGQSAIATKVRTNMKTYLQQWINGVGGGGINMDNQLLYEITYGGLVSKNSVGCVACDFGMYYYNDHHFHYGYFLYAAAAIIKKDAAWGAQMKQKLYEIARDYANPSDSDPYYTKLRTKDWFVGHSFAAGLFTFADSRNQESTSEAINAYYGLYLLGLVYQDTNMMNVGRILLATEIRSAKMYWHVTTKNDIYDPVYAPNKCVGVLWETKVDYATFFGLNVEYIHGIQMLPYTPITDDYVTSDWIKESYPVFSTCYSNSASVDSWKGLLYLAQSTIDFSGAASLVNGLTGYDDGNTKTNTLYWLYSRPQGQAKRTSPFADIDSPGSVTPTPSPSPSPTPTPTPSPSPSPTPTPTPSPSPSGCGCGSGTAACGNACYNTDTYECCSGNTVAAKGTCSGGGTTTDTKCTNVKCQTGYNCCGGACYNPNVFGCYDGMLCATGTKRCGTACYNPDIFNCCGTTLKPKSAGSC